MGLEILEKFLKNKYKYKKSLLFILFTDNWILSDHWYIDGINNYLYIMKFCNFQFW